MKLLQAALDIAGDTKALADALGIEDWLLLAYLDDRRPLPDALLLRAVDLILADQRMRLAPAPAAKPLAPDAAA